MLSGQSIYTYIPIHGRDSAEGGSLSATRNCKTVSDSTTVTPKATFSPESTGSIYDNVANSVITMDGKSISV